MVFPILPPNIAPTPSPQPFLEDKRVITASSKGGTPVSSPLPTSESESIKDNFKKNREQVGRMIEGIQKKKQNVADKAAQKPSETTQDEVKVREGNKKRWRFLRMILDFLFKRFKTPKLADTGARQTVSKDKIKGMSGKDKEKQGREPHFLENEPYQQPTSTTENKKIQGPKTKEEKKIAQLKLREETKIAKKLEPYHYLIKQLQVKVDGAKDLDEVEAIFRESGSKLVVKKLKKNFTNKTQIDQANLTDLASLTKTVIFSEASFERFQELGIDKLFDPKNPLPKEELIKATKDKLKSLAPAEQEFLRDLVKLVDTIYTKSWKQRANMQFETMAKAIPTLGRIFDSKNSQVTTIEGLEGLEKGREALKFVIEHQKTLFA